MDAGMVTFVEGTTLDLQRSIEFKNVDQYCVAPIKMNGVDQEVYDYWAIGLNCCGKYGANFTCGEYDNPHAHAGVRLMREDQRGFYQLAVQQATAAYGMRSNHALFFYWMQDPQAELDQLLKDSRQNYGLGVLAFTMGHFLLTGFGLVAFIFFHL